ncbi:malonyl-ACP O-methyltransferase BioC [Vibrio sp. E150_011]
MSAVLSISDNVNDKVAISIAFGRAAERYDRHAEFQRKVADQLLALLPERLDGKVVLDLGCGTGYCAQALLLRGATLVCADLSRAMLDKARERCGNKKVTYHLEDAEALSFADASFDYVVSSLALQWCDDLALPLKEMKRVTKHRGQCVFSTLVEGSLEELSTAWRKIDEYQHVNQFVSLNQIKIALAQSGCVEYQLDCPKIVMWYQTALDLMKDLKGIGATHVKGRSRGFTGRHTLNALEMEYRKFSNPVGLLPASYQVCLGTVTL